MHASLGERRLHPDEEGAFQSVIGGEETGTAGLHWETKTQTTRSLLQTHTHLLTSHQDVPHEPENKREGHE